MTVLLKGLILGGSAGIGTLVYAFGIGPLIHVMIPAVNRFLPGFAKPTPVVGEAAEVPAA